MLKQVTVTSKANVVLNVNVYNAVLLQNFDSALKLVKKVNDIPFSFVTE